MKTTNAVRREILNLAWRIFRQRHVPGCNVRTFGDALRNAWAWVKRQAAPVIAATRHLRLGSMLQSPIRRRIGNGLSAYKAERTTSAVGA